jgi:hypothetical protein
MERDPVPTVQEAGWAQGPLWMVAENLALTSIQSQNLALTSIQSLDRLALSGLLYQLSCAMYFINVLQNMEL